MEHDLFAYFKGDWTFERKILFTDTEMLYATATGDVAFSSDNSDAHKLQYHETGTLLIAETQHRQPFFRKYTYITAEGSLDIYFNDALTQNFNLYQQYIFLPQTNELIPKEIHVCNKDLYQGYFNLQEDEHFTHTSVVKGPHKDYKIVTHYAKQH